MRFFMITSVLASVAVALAMPAEGGAGDSVLCPLATFSNPRCCATDSDVLGGTILSDCTPRKFSF